MASLATRLPGGLTAGRHGLTGTAAGARLRIMPQRQIVSVIARRGGLETLRSAVREEFKIDMPDKPTLARGSGASFLWCGHQQWFAMADEGAADLFDTLRQRIGNSASLSDQSDSRLTVELSGPATPGILAKLMPIDFHPRAFPVGATALTSLEHVGCQITRTGDEATYEVMAFRSLADSILHGILAAAAEFGVDVA